MTSRSVVRELLESLRTPRVWIGLGFCVGLGTLSLLRMSFALVPMPGTNFGFGFLTLGILLIVLSFVIKAGTWVILLRHVKTVGFFPSFASLLIGHLTDNALGMRVGEVVRAVILGLMEGASIVAVFVTVIIYRLIDGCAIFLFVLTISRFIELPASMVEWSALGLMGCISILGVLALLRRRRRMVSGLSFSAIRPLDKWARTETGNSLQGMGVLGSWLDVSAVFLLSLATRLALAGYYWSIGKAFGLSLPAHSPLALMGLLYYRRFVPGTIISVYERVFKESLGLMGASERLLNAYATISYVDMYFITTIIGLCALFIASFRRSRPTA